MLGIMRHACLCGLALLVPCLAAPGGLAGGFFEELLEEKWDWRAFDFSKEEAQFVQAHKDEYGYNGKLARIRDADTPHVVDQIYLDYTGSGVYRASMVDEMAKGLKKNLYGNPHRCVEGTQGSPWSCDGGQDDGRGLGGGTLLMVAHVTLAAATTHQAC